MNSQWKRMLIAAMISSSIFAATWFWYHATENTFSSNTNEKPVAYAGKVVDDIQRRPASRLLWQSIYDGEALFNGEAIRTSDKGEVRIQFAGSDRYLDLEPESLIVIKKSEGEIALDLMEGSLFVNAKNTAEGSSGGGLVLNSASGKVDLSGATAALSKTKGRGLDWQVLDGKASVQDKNGQSREILKGTSGALSANGALQFNRSSLQILNPQPEKPVYMNAEDLKPVRFQWKGFPADASVSLYLAGSRKDLKEIAKAAPGFSEISSKIPLGKHYWKLIAKNAQGQILGESPIYRVQVVARYAPTALFPAADGEVPAKPNSLSDLTFKWQTGVETRRTTLEVWADPSLKQKVATQTLQDENSFTLKSLKEGTYYWRISGFFEDSNQPIPGRIQKFKIFPSEKMRDPASVKKDIPVVWSGAEGGDEQLYFDKPQVKVDWQPAADPTVSSWKISITDENGTPVARQNLPVSQSSFKTAVDKPGRYLASVEALNKSGEVIGAARERAISISAVPLIPGPKFTAPEPILKAGNDGRADLQWEKVAGAKDYYLTISRDGKELKKLRYTANATALKNLMPGEYEVQINAQDDHGRMSEAGDSRKLIVPDSSSLKAPKLKRIKVD